MKKTNILLAILMAVSAVSLAFADKKNSVEKVSVTKDNLATTSITDGDDEDASDLSSTLIDNINLEKFGLKPAAIKAAVKGYLELKKQGRLRNPNVLTIIDMSQSGRRKRFYLIDVNHQRLLVNTYVAHGMMSGLDMASDFSNNFSSNKTSLGFYITLDTYNGKHGTSLRLAGLEPGFNDNAEARGIVVHAADYVNAGRVNSEYMGRSEGCPALPANVCQKVINVIKGGSAFFIYYPSKNYLNNSRILNT